MIPNFSSYFSHLKSMRFTLGLVCALMPFQGFASAALPSFQDPPLSEQAPEPIQVDPAKRSEVDQALMRGVEFLLKDQNEDGSWGTAERTKNLNIYAPVPGAHHAFRSAVTGLCVSAMVEMRQRCESASLHQDRWNEMDGAIDRGEAWLIKELPKLRRATGDAIYNVWGHAYGIEALARLHGYRASDTDRQAVLREGMLRQVELLSRYESVHGGWGYYDFAQHLQKPTSDPNSFTTATVLYALHQAKQLGVEVPQRLETRGIAVLKRQQRPDLAYLYSETFLQRTGVEINKPGGSVGRSQACNLVLRLYGDDSVTDAAMVAWEKRLFSRNLWLDIGRKRPIPHESWFLVAGYFFYYGHYYAALGIEHLPAENRPLIQHQLAHVMLRLQEKDGSWWDYPLYNYHQQYGTAFALMSLLRCESAAVAD